MIPLIHEEFLHTLEVLVHQCYHAAFTSKKVSYSLSKNERLLCALVMATWYHYLFPMQCRVIKATWARVLWFLYRTHLLLHSVCNLHFCVKSFGASYLQNQGCMTIEARAAI
jgi:hypothetical protein